MPEPLVLLPGMMCDARLFGPQIKAFGADRAIHLAPITGHDTVEALAEEVLASAPQRFALAGLSMGGIVAMEMLRQAPGRITRIALLDTNSMAEPPAKAAEREPQIARVMAGSLVEVMRDEMKPNYLAPGPGRQAVLDLVLDMALDMGEGVFLRQSRALQRRRDQQDVLRKARLPALVLCGEHDALCPVKRHQFMADLIFGAQLRVIPDAGHLSTLEQPEAVNAALAEWLAA
ncbi:pimeloyl-ACP methyl ester carboxylesterase [Litoreibacter ponti]|uniref:Pimeloyl-ACP methyl ester carboxylesterase n=1 Tax=Litoreibacter ponti TaxID=1510457 RepID=A0A2T6BK72_9RHOB|nr:alpha/beta fold hydrolase [Litoreibacter ponti]PTX56458.1 pimeloyl-ACP methyl ester carboxylesterase [Litoreibacter ponti]